MDRRVMITRSLVVLTCVLATFVVQAAPTQAAAPNTKPTFPAKGSSPFVTGQGYWIFVCAAAKQFGYTGDLNRAFKASIHDNDFAFPKGEFGIKVAKEPSPARYTIDRTKGSLPIITHRGTQDLGTFYDAWDNCDSSNASPTFGVRRKPGQTDKLNRYDYNGDGLAQGGIGVGFGFHFDPIEGLAVERFKIDDNIRNYRTADGPNGTAAWEAAWGVGREHLKPKATSIKDTEAVGDQIRVCRGHGTWADARRDNKWFKSVASKWTASGGGYADENFSTTVFGSGNVPFYRAAADDGTYGDYSGMMGYSASTDAVPLSTCHISGDGSAAGSGRWYWSPPGDGLYNLSFNVDCNNAAPSPKACRARDTTTAWREPAGTRAIALNWGPEITASGVHIYVQDDKAPAVKITNSGLYTLNSGNALANDGTVKPEKLTFTASDNGGLRRVRITLTKPTGGKVVLRDLANKTDEGLNCDYRYALPCPGATAGSNRPPYLPGLKSQMNAPVVLNADDLPVGKYSIEVKAWGAVNDTSTATAKFRVDRNLLTDCDGSVVQTKTTLQNCGSDTNICGAAASCTTPLCTTCGPYTPPGGPMAPLPKTGKGVFSYGLAFNNTASGTGPAAASGCKVIENVISGNGTGGGLSDREKNQIVSVTLDFSGFSMLGSSLGTQDLRATFDLPGRLDARYRSALGCPG
jgi:hypothetical protein